MTCKSSYRPKFLNELSSSRPHVFMAWVLITHTDNFTFQEFCLLGYKAVNSSESQSTLRSNISPTSSGSESMPSKTQSEFHRTTWRHIPEDRTLHNHRCENQESNFTIGGFEVLTAVVMKNQIFWDATLCSPVEANRRFEGTCCINFRI
jgi:hypothetical protein